MSLREPMALDLIHRPKRAVYLKPGSVIINIDRLPEVERDPDFQWVQLAIPLLGSASLLGYGLISGNRTFLLLGTVVVIASLAIPILLHFSNRTRVRRRRKVTAERFGEYLDAVQAKVDIARHAEFEFLAASTLQSADGAELKSVGRLWEKRLGEPDFLCVDLGYGPVRSNVKVVFEPSWGDETQNSGLSERVRRLQQRSLHVAPLSRADEVGDAPIGLSLDLAHVVSIEGEEVFTRGLARNVVRQLLLASGPDELILMVMHPPAARSRWDWVADCPHARSGLVQGDQNPLVYSDTASLESALAEILRPRLTAADDSVRSSEAAPFPQLILVVDQYSPFSELADVPSLSVALDRAAELHVSVITLTTSTSHRPSRAAVAVRVDGELEVIRLADYHSASAASEGASDLPAAKPHLESEERLRAAAAVVATCAPATDPAQGVASTNRLADLLGGDPARPADSWLVPGSPEWLTLPIGVSEDGRICSLDLKETADGGDGPHGIIIGATGSGKSELLRSIVCSLATRHSPEFLNMMLADFKGGASFQGLARLPHVVGVATNLVDDAKSLDRIRDALSAEILRRQADLEAAGADVQKISEYQAARLLQPDLPPMPHLVVIIDEFGEMVASREDFLGVLVSVARLGRSVGVHLLLANQRLDAGLIRGLESFLSYRIALRTFTVDDSRAVLGSASAAELPPFPGAGFVKTASSLLKFQAAYLGPGGVDSRSICARLERFPRVDQLWLAPLPDPSRGGVLLAQDGRLDSSGDPQGTVAIGLIDSPATRSQPPLLFDYNRASGSSTVLVGAPRSGKSQALATIIAQMGVHHDRGVQLPEIFVLEPVPFISADAELVRYYNACASFDDAEAVGRIVRHVEGRVYSRADADQGKLADVVFMVDDVASLLERYADLNESVARIFADGRQGGVLSVVTAGRWFDLPPKTLEKFSNRIELSVQDAAASMFRLSQSDIRLDRPGRALVRGQLSAQLAVHRVGGPSDGETSGRCVFRKSKLAASKSVRTKLTMLNELTPAHWESAVAEDGSGVVLGVHEEMYAPVFWQPGSGSHLILSGDRGSGRSRMIARLLGQIGLRWQDSTAFAIDFRGDLARLLEEQGDKQTRLGATADTAPECLAKFLDEVARRNVLRSSTRVLLGAEAVTFPPLLLVLEDYEIVARMMGGVLNDLYPALHVAREINLTVLISEAGVGAASRIDLVTRGLDESGPLFVEFGVAKQREPMRSGRRGRALPFGQAYLVQDGQADRLVQVLSPASQTPRPS